MTLHIAVVGHIARQERAEALAASLGAELFLDRLTLGATWNHLRAINWGAEKAGHLIVLEDDAQPVPGFLDLAGDWISCHPDNLTSFYLGTGKPPQYQARIQTEITTADAAGTDHIILPHLIHAVAYTLPTDIIPALTLNPRRAADTGLGGAWFATTRKPVLYTLPSLVDHEDGASVEQSTKTIPSRKAWRI
jgi:hypothetical protein